MYAQYPLNNILLYQISGIPIKNGCRKNFQRVKFSDPILRISHQRDGASPSCQDVSGKEPFAISYVRGNGIPNLPESGFQPKTRRFLLLVGMTAQWRGLEGKSPSVIPSGARKLKKIEKRTIKERFLLSVGMTAQWRGLEGKRWTAKAPSSSPHLRSLSVIPSGARKLKKIEKWTIKGEIPPFSRNNGTMARIRGEEVAA